MPGGKYAITITIRVGLECFGGASTVGSFTPIYLSYKVGTPSVSTQETTASVSWFERMLKARNLSRRLIAFYMNPRFARRLYW